jgi:hypothetical protein
MSTPQARPLELAEDLHFTRRSWSVERAGWLGIGALLLAAILGGVGPGLLSRVTREAAEGRLHVEFDRTAHYETEGTILVRVRKAEGPGVVEIRIEERYAGQVEIEWTQPRALKAASVEGAIRYTFDAPTATWEGVLHVNYPKIGAIAGRLGLSTGEAVEISQFVFP